MSGIFIRIAGVGKIASDMTPFDFRFKILNGRNRGPYVGKRIRRGINAVTCRDIICR